MQKVRRIQRTIMCAGCYAGIMRLFGAVVLSKGGGMHSVDSPMQRTAIVTLLQLAHSLRGRGLPTAL